jgi:hypothetical protein
MVITLEDIKKLPPKERIEALKKFEAEQKALKEKELKKLEEEAEKVLGESLKEIDEEEEEERLREKRAKKEEESLEDIAEEAEEKAPVAAARHEYRVGASSHEEAYARSVTRPIGELYERINSIGEQFRDGQYVAPEQRREAAQVMRELEQKTKEGYFHNQQQALQAKSKMEETWEQMRRNPMMQRYS